MTGPGIILAIALALATAPAAGAAFADESVTATSGFGAAPDWVAPQVTSTTIAKVVGYLPGSVKQGGSFYVYASVADSGNPPSGVATEQANVTTLAPDGSAVTLVAGSYSVGGVSYGYRSAALTASNPLSAGPYQYSVTSVDGAGNSRTESGFPVVVDNTSPSATDVQTANASGGTIGRAEAGDTLTFTFSELIDPESILAGWTGTSVNVVVRLVDGGCLLNILVKVCSDDSLVVRNSSNSAALPLGTVNLKRNDYHGGGIIGTAPPVDFGVIGSPSTLVQSGTTLTITLGTPNATPDTAAGSGTMTWTPAAGPYDAAGNPASTTAINESGGGDREF